MALQKQVFDNISVAKFKSFVLKVEQDTGNEMTGTSGTVEHGSIEFEWSYIQDAGVLTIQVLRKPLFLKASSVISAIQEEVAELVPYVELVPVPSPVVEEPVKS